MAETRVDVVIVGAGFGGIAALHEVRARGYEALVLEAGSGPGGTWYWNRYPGARCDIESRQYSYGIFPEIEQDWSWSEKFAGQPEILRYLEHVVERQGMAPFIRFDTRVEAAHYDAAAGLWTLRTRAGDMVSARFCVMATGTLSTTNLPAFPGIEEFRGEIHHSGAWPHDGVDMGRKRVGVIGTGSSGVQVIPVAAKEASHLTVFLRTPYYVLPARNRPLDPAEDRATKSDYARLREGWRRAPNAVGMNFSTVSAMEVDAETRDAMFEAAWDAGGGDFGVCFSDLSRNMEANDALADWFRRKIASIVSDPEVAKALTPEVRWGTRRLGLGTDYYETYNRDNVSLVDLRKTPIDGVTQGGIVCGGIEHPIDVLVLATGFDAVTGTLLRMDIRGRDGLKLQDAWAQGARTYLGMASAGFPNFFMISGPQSPGTVINMVPGSELHARWIAQCIAWADEQGARSVEATEHAQQGWLEHVAEVNGRSVMSTSDSWWTGANVPGKPRGYLGYLDWLSYVARCEAEADAGFPNFTLHGADADAPVFPEERMAAS